jgi:hypothetical protein
MTGLEFQIKTSEERLFGDKGMSIALIQSDFFQQREIIDNLP